MFIVDNKVVKTAFLAFYHDQISSTTQDDLERFSEKDLAGQNGWSNEYLAPFYASLNQELSFNELYCKLINYHDCKAMMYYNKLPDNVRDDIWAYLNEVLPHLPCKANSTCDLLGEILEDKFINLGGNPKKNIVC